MIDYKYVYLISNASAIPVWLLLFSMKRLRRKMLVMSVVCTPLSPLSELLYTRDYWQPRYALPLGGVGVEDLLAGFLLGGISPVLFEAVFAGSAEPAAAGRASVATFFTMLAGSALGLIVLTLGLGLNSIYATVLLCLGFGTYMVVKRPDLLPVAIGNALLFLLLIVPAYLVFGWFFPRIFEIGWKIDRLSGWFVAGVPVEEIIWAFSWGYFAGPAYQFWAGLRLVPRSIRGGP